MFTLGLYTSAQFDAKGSVLVLALAAFCGGLVHLVGDFFALAKGDLSPACSPATGRRRRSRGAPIDRPPLRGRRGKDHPAGLPALPPDRPAGQTTRRSMGLPQLRRQGQGRALLTVGQRPRARRPGCRRRTVAPPIAWSTISPTGRTALPAAGAAVWPPAPLPSRCAGAAGPGRPWTARSAAGLCRARSPPRPVSSGTRPVSSAGPAAPAAARSAPVMGLLVADLYRDTI